QVVLVGGATGPRAGDRVGHDVALVHGDQGLRGGSDDGIGAAVGILEVVQVHVGTGVGGAQDAVHVQRVGRAVELEPAGDHDLEDLAVHDGLLAADDCPAVAFLVPAVR